MSVTITTTTFDYSSILDPLLAQELQNRADDIRGLDRGIVHNVIAIGRHLVAAKDRLPHGQFTDWLQSEFGLSHSTANNYMAVAERFGQNPNAVGNLPLRTVYALAPASVPDAAVEEAAALAAGGITVTPSQARDIRDDVAAITLADPAPSADQPDQPSLADRIMATFINGSHVKSTGLLARLTGVDELDLAHELTALVDAGKLRRIGDSGKLFALVLPEQSQRDRHSGPPYERILAAFADGCDTKTTGMIAHLTGLNTLDQHQVALDTLVADGLLLRESGQMYRMTDKTPRVRDLSITEAERELNDLASRIADWLDQQTEPRSVLNMVDCVPSHVALSTIVNAVDHLLARGKIERVGPKLYRIVLLESLATLPEVSASPVGALPAACGAVAPSDDAPADPEPSPAEAKAQQLADEMLAYLRANPPQRFMDIFTHVGKNTRQSDMGATIDALIAAGQIEKVTGEYGEQRYRALPVAVETAPEPGESSGAAQFFAGYGIDPDEAEPTEPEPEQPITTTRPPWTGPNTVYGNDYYARKDAEQSAATEPITDDQPGEAVSAPLALTNVALALMVANAAEALRKHGEGMYYHEIKHFVGGENGEANQALVHGVKVGVLVKDPTRNYYTLPEFAERAQADPDPITDSARAQITWLLESVKTAENACRNLMKFTAQGSWNDIDAATLKDARAAVRRAQGTVEKAALHLSNLYAPLTSANQVAMQREQPEAAEVH